MRRIQRKRTRGWKMPPNAKSVARPSRWGNQYKIGEDGTAEDCVEQHREMMKIFREEAPVEYAKFIEPLRGKDLACFCPLDQPCHADTLLELAAQTN